MVFGHDYYEMKAYPKEQILIVAQHNINTEKIGLNDHYLYNFYIYDMKEPIKKIPLFLSKKRINKNEKNIIDKNLPKILAKYKQYKEGKVSKSKEINLIDFVKSYWVTLSNNYDLKFIEEHLKNEVSTNNKKISKKSFLKSKTDIFNRVKRVEFKLDEFLIYQKNGKYHIEYLKSSSLEYKNKKSQTLYRKSLMVIDEVDGKFMIEAEKDLRILSDSEIY